MDVVQEGVGEVRAPAADEQVAERPFVDDPALVAALMRYHWPGNVRELKNLVKRMLVFSSDLTLDLLPEEIREAVALEGGGGTDPASEGAVEVTGDGLNLSVRFDRDGRGGLPR